MDVFIYVYMYIYRVSKYNGFIYSPESYRWESPLRAPINVTVEQQVPDDIVIAEMSGQKN